MAYEEVEKRQAFNRLCRIQQAFNDFPNGEIALLGDLTLEDLIKLAQFVGRDVKFKFSKISPLESWDNLQ